MSLGVYGLLRGWGEMMTVCGTEGKKENVGKKEVREVEVLGVRP